MTRTFSFLITPLATIVSVVVILFPHLSSNESPTPGSLEIRPSVWFSDADRVPSSVSYQVRSLRHFIPEYSDARKIILDAVKDEELTIEERINLYQSEMNKLRKQFIDERTSEYKSKSVQVQRGHSCTKGNRGGKKDCGWKCATAPQPSLYTQSGWFSVSGTNKGTQVRDNGRHACLKMTKAGKGRNAGVITATFRYRPEYIAATVQEEATELFYLISNPENAGE